MRGICCLQGHPGPCTGHERAEAVALWGTHVSTARDGCWLQCILRARGGLRLIGGISCMQGHVSMPISLVLFRLVHLAMAPAVVPTGPPSGPGSAAAGWDGAEGSEQLLLLIGGPLVARCICGDAG